MALEGSFERVLQTSFIRRGFLVPGMRFCEFCFASCLLYSLGDRQGDVIVVASVYFESFF
jgi:hypothetical protein